MKTVCFSATKILLSVCMEAEAELASFSQTSGKITWLVCMVDTWVKCLL